MSKSNNKARIVRICAKYHMSALSPPRILKLLDLLENVRGDSINHLDLWTLVRLVHRGLLD